MFTNVYRENNAITSKLPVAAPILGQKFVSLLNGTLTVGALPNLQHLGVSVESVVTGDCDYIVSGHVRIVGADFTVGFRVAANRFGRIDTVDKLESGSGDRVGGNIYIIGFALTTDTFLLQIDHTKPLLAFLIEGTRYMSELFNAVVYKEPSPDFPALCVSLRHAADSKAVILNATNWPTLVPSLRSVTWLVGTATPDIAYTSFAPGIITEIVLSSANVGSNTELLNDIVSTVRYFNNLEIDAALTSIHYLNLNLTLRFKNEDCRIIDVNLITQTISIDFDSTSLTTDTGNVQIYPHRLPSMLGSTVILDNLTKAQFRKLKPETTLASGYATSKLLTDRFQGHQIGFTILTGSSGFGPAGTGTDVSSTPYHLSPITDGVNGTPRVGKTTRGNLLTTYVYIYGGQYVA